MAREKTQTFETHGNIGKVQLRRRISTQTFKRAEVQRHSNDTSRADEITRRTRLIRGCCRRAVKDGCFRDTAIENTVWTECGHYVTVKKGPKKP